MFEIAQLIGNSRGTDLVVLCGDFNTRDNHPAYRLMTTYLGLQVIMNSDSSILKVVWCKEVPDCMCRQCSSLTCRMHLQGAR